MRRASAFAVTAVLAIGAGIGTSASPASAWVAWPMSLLNHRFFGPSAVPPSPAECGDALSGTYGSVFFVQTIAKVNYGGTCNVQHGMPAGYMYSQTLAYKGLTVVANSGPYYNGFAATYVQSQVPGPANADSYTEFRQWQGYFQTSWNTLNLTRQS